MKIEAIRAERAAEKERIRLQKKHAKKCRKHMNVLATKKYGERKEHKNRTKHYLKVKPQPQPLCKLFEKEKEKKHFI